MSASNPSPAPEWRHSPGLTPYDDAIDAMEARVAEIQAGRADGLVWLLEHPPLYTAGTSARDQDLLSARFPVHETGRGGQYTYHGPGQRVAYVMMDLKKLFAPSPPDLRAYVARLEDWIIATLKEFGVEGFTREGRVGVWVKERDAYSVLSTRLAPSPSTEYASPSTEKKIAALGVRVQKWVAYHGICLNVNPDLSHYAGIVPCGIRDFGVTSLHALGVKAAMEEVDAALRQTFDAAILRQTR